jgi:hypothetical protein
MHIETSRAKSGDSAGGFFPRPIVVVAENVGSCLRQRQLERYEGVDSFCVALINIGPWLAFAHPWFRIPGKVVDTRIYAVLDPEKAERV